MHEYDVNERKEEPASLPLPSSDTTDTRSTSPSESPISQPALQLQTTQEQLAQQEQQQEQQEQEEQQEQQQEQQEHQQQQEEQNKILHYFPEVLEFIDRVAVANTEVAQLDEPQKKRQRRVYVASYTRCASLRSNQKPPPPPPSPGREAEVKQQPPPSPSSYFPPAQAAASPTPTESPIEYLKSEHFKPEFWNLIEEAEPERKTAAKKRRGGNASGRTRARRNQIINDLELYSPETAAAIAAAQAELNATGKTARGRGFGRTSRKRINPGGTPTPTPTTSTMSLYDRRYQSTTDERRGVANGYGAGSNVMRVSNASGPGSASLASEIGESQELSQSSHQYYGSGSGSSNATGAVSGLNGSASVALNHAPSMGTLCNIGNTCYLNSVVYTLRFAPHFLHNLHHLIQDLTVVQQTIVRQQQASRSASLGRNASVAQLEHARSWSSKDLVASTDQQQQYSGLNGGSSGAASSASNASGASISAKPSHQSVTENLHELYNNLHGNEMADSTEPYHADTLLHAIQDVNATFEGNQQQDAHEFLMCVLNCIRETNQSLIKAIGECPEVIANGYIANPDDMDSGEGQDRTDSAAISSNNGSLATTSHITTTKTSFFSRKSKRKDEVKSSKATRIQSPLKDKDNSPTATGGISGAGHATANSLFYLNTVDLTGGSGGGGGGVVPPTPPPAMSQLTKYSSDDDTNSAMVLKDKMRLEERIRELNLNFFSSDFEGIVVLTTKCLSCETVTRQKQGMLDISVPVPISGYDNELQDKQPSTYIQSSCMTKEYFRGENKYSCNQCTGYTEAIRSISYEVLPRLLVIQLNRFSGGMEKVSTYVPTTFTLPCFCAKCCDLAEGHKLHVYKLYSVITHVGATLTVGHYIAYTCFLDLASDYMNCPKDRRNTIMTGNNTQTIAAAAEAENSAPSSTPVAAAASALASSGSNLMKKMKFGRGKTSSSGDLSKNLKQLNGISSKAITNGIQKLSMNNTTCHGVQCCAMRLCCSNGNSSNSNSASCSDFSEESLQNGSNSNLSSGGSYPTGYGSTGRGGVKANYVHGGPDPIWYMCDDDKIKAMSQREFEELLSPTRKITITPYLLFYARFDLQTPAKPGTSSTPPPPPAQQPPGSAQSSSSWSNDNSKI